jgi:sucrose-6-phosphate hydrolase SacC (GH32 family)
VEFHKCDYRKAHAQFLAMTLKEMKMEDLIKHSRELRSKFLEDPHRPTYHFAAPEGLAMPFDPNGCIYWRNKYHLMYIFQDHDLPHGGHCWGHVSSIDLVHWTHHPTALAPRPGDPDQGIFSGNAFVNKQGEATILYHGCGVGNCIATSSDDDLVNWTKLSSNPIVPSPKEGDPDFGKYSSWDPHGWLEEDTYYGLFGGGTATLFRSKDLVNWEYLHPFIQTDRDWIDPDEDCSCPDFFPLGDRHMLLCISHKRGCRYYLGRYENETFYPESHARMNWPGGTCFAPESLLDDKGRRIMWAWVLDRRSREVAQASGWSGVMTLPRVLSLGEDGTLRIEPVEELAVLRLNHRKREDVGLKADGQLILDDISGDALELAVEMHPQGAREFGVIVRRSPGGEEQTVITCDLDSKKLKVDFSRSSLDKIIKHWTLCMGGGENPEVQSQEAPFELRQGEPLKLRVFLDRSILEVYANDRQCVTQRIYPTRSDSLGVALLSRGGNTLVKALDAWDMAAANPW